MAASPAAAPASIQHAADQQTESSIQLKKLEFRTSLIKISIGMIGVGIASFLFGATIGQLVETFKLTEGDVGAAPYCVKFGERSSLLIAVQGLVVELLQLLVTLVHATLLNSSIAWSGMAVGLVVGECGLALFLKFVLFDNAFPKTGRNSFIEFALILVAVLVVNLMLYYSYMRNTQIRKLISD